MLKPDNYAKKLNRLIDRNNLKQFITLPTRGDNLLDLIISNIAGELQIVIEDTLYYQSDHMATVFQIPTSKKKANIKTISFRDFRNIDVESLNSVVDEVFQIHFTESVPSNVEAYFLKIRNAILEIFDRLAPVRVITVPEKEFNIPISDELKKLKKEAQFHFKQWKSTKIPYHSNMGIQLKKKIKIQAKISAKNYFGECIEKKGIWDSLQNVFNLNFKAKGSCSYDELDVNMLNNFFTEIPFPPGIEPFNTLDTSIIAERPESEALFYVDCVTNDDLKLALKGMKKNRPQIAITLVLVNE